MIAHDCRNIVSEEMLQVGETLSRHFRMGGESRRRDVGLPVINIDAGESNHEFHRGWNPIPLKSLERFRMAA